MLERIKRIFCPNCEGVTTRGVEWRRPDRDWYVILFSSAFVAVLIATFQAYLFYSTLNDLNTQISIETKNTLPNVPLQRLKGLDEYFNAKETKLKSLRSSPKNYIDPSI